MERMENGIMGRMGRMERMGRKAGGRLEEENETQRQRKRKIARNGPAEKINFP